MNAVPPSLRKSTGIPASITAQHTALADVDVSKLQRNHSRLKSEHARLMEKYKGLVDVRKAEVAKHETEVKAWKKCKRMLEKVMHEYPGFREACAGVMKQINAESEEHVPMATTSTLREDGPRSTALPTATAGSAAKVTGKRKRGDSSPRTVKKAHPEWSSANATPTKNISSARRVIRDQPLNPLRSPPKQSPRHMYARTHTGSPPRRVTATPKRIIEKAAAAPFSDASDAHMQAMAEAQRDRSVSPEGDLLSEEHQSAAEAYLLDEQKGLDANEKQTKRFDGSSTSQMIAEMEDHELMARIACYESGAYSEIPDHMAERVLRESRGYGDGFYGSGGEEGWPPFGDTEEFLGPDEALRQENAEIEQLVLRNDQRDAELYTREDIPEGPTSSQAAHLGLARPIVQAVSPKLSPGQACASGRNGSTFASGLACIYPMPKEAYDPVSPAKSVIDETIPPRRLPKRSRPRRVPLKETSNTTADIEAARALSEQPSAREVGLFGYFHASKGSPTAAVGTADARAPAIVISELASERPSLEILQLQADVLDDEQTETSSQPSSPPRAPRVLKTIAVRQVDRHAGTKSSASPPAMPTPPHMTNAVASAALPDMPHQDLYAEDQTATQELPRPLAISAERSTVDPLVYDPRQRLPAFAKSAVFDEDRDLVKRTLRSEKLPPRKAKAAQQGTGEPVKAKELLPGKTLEESHVGNFIKDLKGTTAIQAEQDASTAALQHPAASQTVRAGSPPVSQSMWRNPANKKKRVNRTASAIAAVRGASIKGVLSQDASSSLPTAPLMGKVAAGPAKSLDQRVMDVASRASRTTTSRLHDLSIASASRDELEAKVGVSKMMDDPVHANVAGGPSQQATFGAPQTAASGSCKPMKLVSSSGRLDTPVDEGKKGNNKKKKRKSGIELPDDIEDDLLAVGRVIMQSRGTPGGENTPRPKALNVNKLINQNEQKRKRESAGPSSLSKSMKRRLEQEAIVGSADTPVAGSASKRTKGNTPTAKVSSTVVQSERERDYSEPYQGQDLLRHIHKQRKAAMSEDPFRHKGKGAYADQVAG